MRVAALYDIHANLPALQAVLAEVHQAGISMVVVGGDVLPGPMPRETLDCLLELNIPVQFIYGNGEVAVLEELAGKLPANVPEPFRPIIRWTAQQIRPHEEILLRTWPKTCTVAIPGLGDVLFCHATPRDENEVFTRLTPEERLAPLFAALDVPVVVCGHTHMQSERRIGTARVVNAGSVGMPFGEPGADWLVLGPEIHLRHTRYDFIKAADQIRATDYPQAREFAATNVLSPPSESTMLDLFTRA